MNRNFFNYMKTTILSIILLLFIGMTSVAQSTVSVDSLSLNQVMERVIQNHPLIKKAEESVKQGDARLGIARSGYLPTVDASLSVSHIGPVPEISLPNSGSFQLVPDNNFDASIGLHQNIYDFGKTASSVTYAQEQLALLNQNIGQIKQKLAIQVVNNYFMLVYFQQAIGIKNIQLETLHSHLDYVQKKKATGSGTDFEILSTQVKISVVENQKIDLLASRDMQMAKLNALMGDVSKRKFAVENAIETDSLMVSEDSVFVYATNHRTEMQLAQKRVNLATTHLNLVKHQNNPSINFLANGGFKNGYVPDLNQIKANYALGIGLNVPVFDGKRSRMKEQEARSEITASELDVEALQRQISTEVVESSIKLQANEQKVAHMRMQLSQAEAAYKMAQVNFSAGVITNLELLDAATTVSETRLMVIKSEIDYTISVYLYKAALGKVIY